MNIERNKDIAKNIKKFVKEKGVTQKELAKAIEISPSTLSDYLNLRSNPSHGVIQKIADYFGVYKSDIDTSYKEGLSNGILDVYNKLEKQRQTKVYNYAEYQLEEQSKVISLSDYVEETMYGHLSAGSGEFLTTDIQETVQIPKSIVPDQHYDLVLQVNGDSMEPMFEDNEYVFVRKTKDIRSGQIGVLIINGESFLKKIYINDDHLRLVSLNKKYDDLIFDDVDDIKVIGTVVM